MFHIYLYIAMVIVFAYILINFTFTLKSLEAIHKEDTKRQKQLNRYEDITQVVMDIVSIVALIVFFFTLMTWVSGLFIFLLGALVITLSITEYLNHYKWQWKYDHMKVVTYKIMSMMLFGVVLVIIVLKHN